MRILCKTFLSAIAATFLFFFAFAIAPTLLLAQSLSVYDLAKLNSTASGVGLATAITDVVTKLSSSSIKSGLADRLPNSSIPSGPDVFALPNPDSKGYKVRSLELDPRFVRNATSVARLIIPDQLPPRSPNQGFQLDEEVINSFICTSSPTGQPTCTNLAVRFPPATASLELDEANGRIFSGVAIRPEADVFPDSVALVGKGKSKICSGVLIKSDMVVTAAHCFCDGIDDEALIGTSALSPLDRIPVDKPKSESFQACSNIAKDLSIGDVALLKLQRNANVARKDVTELAQVKAAASVKAVGFGRTSTSIGFKYQVNIVITSWQCDGSAFGGIPDSQAFLCKPSYELVAAGLNRDTCAGDSGGGIYVYGDDSKPYLVGITSRAVTPDNRCGTGGVYVLLSAPPIRDWLVQRGVTFKSP